MSEVFEGGRRARVTARYERVYPDPIVIQAGDEIRVEREDEEAVGFLKRILRGVAPLAWHNGAIRQWS
jgi:hypothetical protein